MEQNKDKTLEVKPNPFLFFRMSIALKTLLAFFVIAIIPFIVLFIVGNVTNKGSIFLFNLIGIFLSFLIAVAVLRDTKKPLRALLRGMEKFGSGELTVKVNINTGDEFELLGNGFNVMVESVNKREDRLQKYNKLSDILISTLDPQDLLNKALHQFIELTHSHVGCIHIFDDEELTLKPFACSGVDKNFLKELREGEGLPWRVVEGKDSIFLKGELKEGIRVNGGFGELVLKGVFYLPILYKERLYGVISIGSIHGYPPNEVNLYQYLVNQIAIALDNALVHKDLETLSITDGLTGLYNRRYIMMRLEEEFKEAGRYHYPLSVIFFDIDDFKPVNDTYGHQAGDRVLKGIAGLIRKNLRELDLAGRYGGEEFLIVLPHTPNQKARIVGEKLRQKVKEERFEGLDNLSVTISLGLATLDRDEREITGVHQLIDRADHCLYRAKERGKDQMVSFCKDALTGALTTNP